MKTGVIINVVVKIGNAMVKLFDSREGWAPTPSFLSTVWRQHTYDRRQRQFVSGKSKE